MVFALRLRNFLGCTLIASLLALAFVTPLTAQAQSVEEVIDNMKAVHAQQLDAVDDYIIETNQYTSYHQKPSDDAESYVTETEWAQGAGMLENAPIQFQSHRIDPDDLDRFADHATYGGEETIEGTRVHTLVVEDASAMLEEAPQQEAAMSGSMTLYVHAENHVPVRVEYTGQMQQQGETVEVNPVIRFLDYRTIDGLTVPHRIEMTMADLDDIMTAEQQEMARQNIDQMEERMDQMSEEQRAMMEEQVEQMRQILEDGGIEFTVEVSDVTVNEGIPDDRFSALPN